MEWIPLMLLVTTGGLVLGVTALVLRPFAGARTIGRRLSICALITGIASTLFFAAVAGNHFVLVAYLFVASPAIVGGIAFEIYPRKINEARGFPVISADDLKNKP